jgi:hypothetical protein
MREIYRQQVDLIRVLHNFFKIRKNKLKIANERDLCWLKRGMCVEET